MVYHRGSEPCSAAGCLNQSHPRAVTVIARPATAADHQELHDHQTICHGEAPPLLRHPRTAEEVGRTGEAVAIHLGITRDGTRLVLFRQGHLPQVIRVGELVSSWLTELGHSTGLDVLDEQAPFTEDDARRLGEWAGRVKESTDGT
jgi:hypothetical protein